MNKTTMLHDCFSTDAVNTRRQIEIDLVKVVLIFLMILTHCFEYLSTDSVQNGGWYYLVVTVVNNLLGGSACSFMMCMGIGIAYSRKSTPEAFIKRGAFLLLGGYVLNAIRFGIPEFFLYLGGLEKLEWVICDLLALDIMLFAGIAMMLFGLLKKFHFTDWMILATALLMSVVGTLFRFIPVKNYLLSCLTGLFIGTINPTYTDGASGVFPLCNWFLAVVLGYLYGKMLRRCKDPDHYYAVVTPIAGAVIVAYMGIAVPFRLGLMNGDIFIFYHMSTPNVFLHLVNLVFLSGLYHFAAKHLSDGLKKRISTVSINLNTIYWIQWIIIGWTCCVITKFNFEKFGSASLIVIGLLIYVISIFLSCRLRKQRH